MQQMTMAIAGMSCGGCVSTVRKALGDVPGTYVDAVSIGSATVSYDAMKTTPATIAHAVSAAGYVATAPGMPAADAMPVAVGGGCCGGGSTGGGSCCG